MIIAGIWQGQGKPPFKSYFSKFSEMLNNLTTHGVYIDNSFVKAYVKLAVVCCTVDLPAKAGLLNMTQYNGTQGCISCEEPGEVVSSGKGHARSYPYRPKDDKYSSRTSDTVEDAMSRGSDNQRVKGFKGITGLVTLNYLDLEDSIVPDYMHGVLLGATKGLMNNWFSPTKSGKEYFIGKHLKAISQRLKSIKPPNHIERLPCDLEKNYNNLKATELQSWLLFYSIPCLINILPDKFLSHFSLLSEGVYILLGDSINQQSLKRARSLLTEFYKMYNDLYPDSSCGLNIHNIGDHLVQYVERWGPLWAWSCFCFEDSNAMLLQSVHGTGLVTKQVIKQRAAQLALRAHAFSPITKDNAWKITVSANNCAIAGGIIPLSEEHLDRDLHFQKKSLGLEGDLFKAKRIVKNGTKFSRKAIQDCKSVSAMLYLL